MEKCVVCEKEYNGADPVTHPPTCSESCWWFWIYVVDHRGEPCWIPGCLEVYCRVGYCNKCIVFQIEQEINKRGLRKTALIGNY